MLFHGRKEVRKIVDKFDPDIIHVQGNGSILFSTLGLKKNNLILTQHGILKNEFKQQSTIKGKLSYFINIFTELICSMKIINYIFISEYNMKIFFKSTNKKILSKLIYNPVNMNFFNVPDIIENNNRLVYIGGIMKRKGLLDLIKVLKDLDQKGIKYSLDVIGGVVEQNYKNDIDKIINDCKLQTKIKFHGWKSQKDIIKIISDVDILVLPSYQETLPVTISEAMAAGKVVIASNVGGVSEMIDSGKDGFLYDVTKPEQLKEILINLYHRKNLKIISTKARCSAKEKYNPKNVCEKTIEFYSVVNNQSKYDS